MTPPQPSALTTPVLIALVLLGLLTVTERVGLPGLWVQSFFFAILILTLLAVLWLAGTTQERAFLGALPALEPLAGAMVLSTAISAAVASLVPSFDGPQWLASLIGAPVGLLLAHGLARTVHRRKNHLSEGNQSTREDPSPPTTGMALLLIGAALAMAALDQAQLEIVRLLSLTTGTSMALAAAIAMLAVLVGGLRAGLAQAALMALAAVMALVLMLGIGLVHLGALPLPGQSETATLTAIAEARGRWAITTPLQVLVWPDWSSVLQGEGLKHLAVAALIAAGIALAVSPGLPVRRRSLTGMAVAGTIILPLAVMAIAGYAIEAAAINFVGASITRPPVALVESARTGLVSVCGMNPATAEALRMACGVSPRDTVALDWGQIGLSQTYMRSGLSTAFGYPAAVSMTVGLLTLAWMISLATLGLAVAAKGLGLHILARKHQAAGLASLRLGLVRLAALLLALAFAIPAAVHAKIDGTIVLAGMLTGCGLLLVLVLWSALRKPATTAVDDVPATQIKTRKRKAPGLPGSEPT
jgi:hypothetical protein